MRLLILFGGLFLMSCTEVPAPRLSDSDDSNDSVSLLPVCVNMQTTKGNISLSLNREKAPESVSNFLAYVDADFYDGVIFHRVISNFVIQGGGFTETLQQKSTSSPIVNEADNGLLNLRGTIAMARLAEPHSATSEFFINLVDNDFLDFTAKTNEGWGYAVFGKVTQGLDVVDVIGGVETGADGIFTKDVPVEDIVVNDVTRVDCG